MKSYAVFSPLTPAPLPEWRGSIQCQAVISRGRGRASAAPPGDKGLTEGRQGEIQTCETCSEKRGHGGKA